MIAAAWRIAGGIAFFCVTALAGALAAPEVRDDAGHRVRLPTPAQRIVALAPFLTELVFSADGGGRLVGVSDHSDYPEAARKVPRVASAAGIDYERILMLQPDLVLVWRSGNGAMVPGRLRELGLAVFVSEPRDPRDIARNLRAIARLLDTERQSEPAVRRFEAEVQMLRRRYAQRKPVSVFYQISQRPLMTLNGQHIVSAALRICGGRNIFSAAVSLAPTVDREAVARIDPQIVLIDGTIPGAEALRRASIEHRATTAARNGHVYLVDGRLVTRPTLRFVRGIEQLCGLLERAR